MSKTWAYSFLFLCLRLCIHKMILNSLFKQHEEIEERRSGALFLKSLMSKCFSWCVWDRCTLCGGTELSFGLVCFGALVFLSNLCLQFCEHIDNINTQNLRLAMFPGQLRAKWQLFRNLQLFREGKKILFFTKNSYFQFFKSDVYYPKVKSARLTGKQLPVWGVGEKYLTPFSVRR